MDLFITTTLICILSDVIPFLIKLILSQQYAQKKYDHELWDELKGLKQEMAGISMVNEFAKYARVQRKYNKLESNLKDNIKQRQNQRLKLQLFLNYIFYAINGTVILLLMYMYNDAIVIDLPKDMFWPIQRLLSWPTKYESGISLISWIMITKSGIFSCKNLYK